VKRAWSHGQASAINLATNEPTPPGAFAKPFAPCSTNRIIVHRAARMADEFSGIDTRSEVLGIIGKLAHGSTEVGFTGGGGRGAVNQ